MDKLMDNPWFMRVVALLLAVLLFASVPKNDPNKPGDVDVPSDEKAETITNFPVKSYYDTKNLVVTGVPDTVKITLTGPNNLVQQAKTLRNFEVYVDLSKQEIGKQKVKLKVKDISDRISVVTEPEYVNVSIQEKVTKEFKVEAEFTGSLVEEGYIAEKPVVKPNKVKITGAKDVIDRITYVKATVNASQKISETITQEATVLALDRDMNKQRVEIEPKTVDVTIPVKSSSKKVPIEIVKAGKAPDGVTIDSITLDRQEATIIADPEKLPEIKNVRVEVDISTITEDTELTLPILISDDVVKVSPETVTLKIKVKKQTEKTVSNIPIEIEGLDNQYLLDFLSPDQGQMDLTVSGPSEVVSSISKENLKLFIDVSGLNEGKHRVPIQVNGLNSVTWEMTNDKADIKVSKREA